MNLLIAEDTPFSRKIIETFLKTKQINYVIVENGREAIEKVKENDFDIVFMDIEMPEMNGYEASKYIRTKLNEPKCNVPIIALTGYNNADIEDELKKHGFSDYVLKSQFIHVFENISRKHLSNQKIENTKTSSKPLTVNKHYNLSYFEKFADGDKSFIKEMMKMFIKETPEIISQLNHLYKNQNWQELKILAHKFSPRLSYIGMDETMNIVSTLEKYALNEDLRKKIPELLKIINTDCKIVLEELEKDFL